jgi:hypothetical protein
MKLAIMQPYYFPYIGYWQLIHAVDRFVIYDDVNYIKGGWINRNRLLINDKPAYITVPLYQSSSYKRICDTALQPSPSWRDKLAKMVENTYRKASCFTEVFPVVEELIRYESDNLADYLANQLRTLSVFMNIDTDFIVSSRCYENNNCSGQERILDICKREGATTYINPQGGQELYNTGNFHNSDIALRFITMHTMPYTQRASEFVPYLSIIDALMALGPIGIRHHLDAFDLIETA